MTGNDDGRGRWSVGALAKATGLTVRTLHHYDELGLLRPGERTRAGHRRYTEQDVQRLYRIRLLRQLGMSLEKIREVLDERTGTDALRDVLNRRLDEIDDQLWRLNALRNQIGGLLEQLAGSPQPRPTELLALFGRTSLFHDDLSREQREVLDRRASEIGADGRKWLDGEWRLVLADLVRHCQADDPVDDPAVRRTAARLKVVMDMFTGGDPAVGESVVLFFREHGLGVVKEVLPGTSESAIGEELWDYVGRILTQAD
ncbi:MerR family transcriptional regulator [Amycolatopsis cynarae]|uniref:MerR family transcriptional regulator n=1 Tax=Amycolatopsis cynarae TaxID=2995223 RepID=A0ABY7AXA3_9PSEU|nr:MerR family transcriptional regulator [Amycolatopsis sp. HUAS 11-8]WAL64646.1 MerR family transcriptional regulator [Amycolatopsis sp. HUAS 11-8]